MEAISRREANDVDVIFILEDGVDAFMAPDVNEGVGNHASVAAGRGGPKGVDMIDVELARAALDNQPGLVMWRYRAGVVELRNIEGACLRPQGRESNLIRDKR